MPDAISTMTLSASAERILREGKNKQETGGYIYLWKFKDVNIVRIGFVAGTTKETTNWLGVVGAEISEYARRRVLQPTKSGRWSLRSRDKEEVVMVPRCLDESDSDAIWVQTNVALIYDALKAQLISVEILAVKNEDFDAKRFPKGPKGYDCWYKGDFKATCSYATTVKARAKDLMIVGDSITALNELESPEVSEIVSGLVIQTQNLLAELTKISTIEELKAFITLNRLPQPKETSSAETMKKEVIKTIMSATEQSGEDELPSYSLKVEDLYPPVDLVSQVEIWRLELDEYKNAAEEARKELQILKSQHSTTLEENKTNIAQITDLNRKLATSEKERVNAEQELNNFRNNKLFKEIKTNDELSRLVKQVGLMELDKNKLGATLSIRDKEIFELKRDLSQIKGRELILSQQLVQSNADTLALRKQVQDLQRAPQVQQLIQPSVDACRARLIAKVAAFSKITEIRDFVWDHKLPIDTNVDARYKGVKAGLVGQIIAAVQRGECDE